MTAKKIADGRILGSQKNYFYKKWEIIRKFQQVEK